MLKSFKLSILLLWISFALEVEQEIIDLRLYKISILVLQISLYVLF